MQKLPQAYLKFPTCHKKKKYFLASKWVRDVRYVMTVEIFAVLARYVA
jgi:hypothetical protein